MGKYEPLSQFLDAQTTAQLPMTFQEIEQILGFKLPPSAYHHRPWWANEASNHVHAKAWLKAGFETEQVDMAGRKLVFKRINAPSQAGLAEAQRDFRHETKTLPPRRHPLFGALKGTFTIEPGYDLTQPAMPEWADMLDEQYGPEKTK